MPIGVSQAGVDGVGEPLAHGGGGELVEQGGGEGHVGSSWARRVRRAVETRWRAATTEQPSAARDGVVVEVVDEAQPQGGLRAVGQRADERLEAVVVELGLGGDGGRPSVSCSRDALAVVVEGGRGGDAVEPRAQVVGVAQPRIGAQRAQQGVLEDVLAVGVAGEPPRVDQQLVAVGLDERPERGQGDRAHPCNVAGRRGREPRRPYVAVRISAKVDYAMRALVELAANGDGSPVTAERLAEAQGIPQKFLQNILLELRRAGIVASHRGPDGGHVLAKPPDRITVADVIRAVDGPLGSVAGRAPEDMEYQGSTMRLRDTWVAVRASVRSVLEGITLEDIASDHLPPSIANLLDGTDAWIRR